ncbi:unnamed protein product [Alopecurus aequalis]
MGKATLSEQRALFLSSASPTDFTEAAKATQKPSPIAATAVKMMLTLRRLSGHLSSSLSAASAETMLLPLRRLPGHLRRSLSTVASPPPWAMIYRFALPANTTGAASFAIATPPSATLYSLPELAFNLEERKPNPDRRYVNHHGVFIFAASSDGLLLLNVAKHRVGAQASRELPVEELVKEVVEQEHVRFVCNPVTGQLFRLPNSANSEKLMMRPPTGLLTQADGGHGPPTRYAAVDIIGLPEEGRFLLSSFSSETGKWDLTMEPSPLPPGREMRMDQHEAIAFGGRLWWVDVSWGAVSVDPFGDRPELGYIKLPRRSVIPHQSEKEICELIKYRRMGVSDGRLRYVEVSDEAPFQIRSFMLDDESGRWTLEHQVSLGNAAKERPLIGAIDPLKADLLYLNMGGVAVVCLDMRWKKVVDRYSVPSSVIPQCYCASNVFLPCVLPSFLGSCLIPGKKDAPKQKTLADVLVRSDICQK